MIRKRKSSGGRKIELVALVDVIFLLLIFFLVTLNIAQSFSKPGKREGWYGIANMDAEHAPKGELVVLIDQYPRSNPRYVYYIWIKGEANPEGLLEIGDFCDAMLAIGGMGNPVPDIRKIMNRLQLSGGVELRADRLTKRLAGVEKVMIVCPERLQYGFVHEVIRACNRAEMPPAFEVVPRDLFDDIYQNSRDFRSFPVGDVIRDYQ